MAKKPTLDTPAPEAPAAASAEVTAPAPETAGPAEGATDAGISPGTPSGGGDKPEGPSTLTVVGPAKGRWRAGRHFGPTPRYFPVSELTEAEIAALQADPELTVIAS